MAKRETITRELAESLAIQALSFIASDPERLKVFVGQTGLRPDQIRIAAADPRFLSGVLDHLVADERLLCAFADEAGIKPGMVMRAHEVLSGFNDGVTAVQA